MKTLKEYAHIVEQRLETLPARLPEGEYAIGGMTAYGSLLGPYVYDWHRRAAVRRFYAADNERLTRDLQASLHEVQESRARIVGGERRALRVRRQLLDHEVVDRLA